MSVFGSGVREASNEEGDGGNQVLTGKATPAEAFKALAMAASASTGSSLGTLAMTALMNLGKGAADKPSIEIGELAAMLDAAMETVLKRGGAKLGDKTVVDSLAAVIEALRGASESAAAKAAASAAAQRALAIFRDQPSRIGRAGRYGDKSRGLDDPGMLAFAILCDSLASD